MATWARHLEDGYEVSSAGDSTYSALFARLRDGRTIEEAYQLDVKGYRKFGNDWRLGKGEASVNGKSRQQLWDEYVQLWRTWCEEDPSRILSLAAKSAGMTLTDRFATTSINQAHALSVLLEEHKQAQQSTLTF